jgi:hypothetical protein
MFIGIGIFAVISVLVVVAFLQLRRREKEYERGE